MLASRLAAVVALTFVPIAPAAAQPAVQTIDVQSFSFAPKPIHLAAGKPVTLALVNHAGGGHDFTAPEFFANSTITAGQAPNGKIALPAHATRTITLIPRAGTYKAHCSHFLHSSFGMTNTIVVD
jgi:plastocyanin